MKIKWFDIWYEDMKSNLETMKRNLQADLEAGYNPEGTLIYSQKLAIEEKQKYFDSKVEEFKFIPLSRINQWCYFDLKIRGAIS